MDQGDATMQPAPGCLAHSIDGTALKDTWNGNTRNAV